MQFIYRVIPCELERVENGEYILERESRENEDSPNSGVRYETVEAMGLKGWEAVAIWPKSEEYLRDFVDDESELRFINLVVFKKQVV